MLCVCLIPMKCRIVLLLRYLSSFYSGEFHLRLRQLEKSLLQALNDAKGKILDDDSVITTLETLKQEAAEIGKKVEETDKVISEIETVSQQYLPLSQVFVRTITVFKVVD